MQRKKVLIITCSGGNGLLQAAQAKEDEVLAKNPDAIIIKRDTMVDWMGSWFGALGKFLWNGSQKKGNVLVQVLLLKGQVFVEYMVTFQLFILMFRLLCKEDVDRIIDTQIFGPTAFIKAIRLINWLKKKDLVLEKVMIDLPTKKAEHFFLPIRRLTKKDKPYIKFVTIKPLMDEKENETDFWREKCKLPLKNIIYEPYIVRKCFYKFAPLEKCTENMQLSFSFSSIPEKQEMKSCFSRGPIVFKENKDSFVFSIQPDDFVITILLGSQPSYLGTMGYVERIMELAKKTGKKIYLFIFCAEYKKGKNTLFSNVCNKVISSKDFPESLSIIPFSYQKPEKIAPLLYRTNQSITRSGGGTAMELMAVMRGQIFIHTEALKKAPTRSELLKGIPGHESGAAEYLEKSAQAIIVNPELFYSYMMKNY